MLDTPEEALAKIKELGFPKIFEDIWNRTAPVSLAGPCDRPLMFFEPDIRVGFPCFANYLPLWEQDAIIAYDMDKCEYVKHYFEDEAGQPIGKTYQQLVSSLFIDLAYCGLIPDQTLAKAFHYDHLDALREFVAADYEEESALESKRRFINATDSGWSPPGLRPSGSA